jgi:hypothetical protein
MLWSSRWFHADTAILPQPRVTPDDRGYGGFAVTFSLAMPMNYAHDEYLGRPSCPKCGALIAAPEVSTYVTGSQIRHKWSCDDCDYHFHTLIQLSEPDVCA